MAEPGRPIALGARAIAGGTGISSYAATTLRALREAGVAPLLLDAPERGGGAARLGRWIGALDPRARAAVRRPDTIRLPDLFRQAQVWFDVWRRPMTLAVPGPAGLIHWTHPVPVRIGGWINLYTVHDAIPLAMPDLTAMDGPRHARLLAALARAGGRFVTVSAAAQAEIATTTGWAAGDVPVLGQAIDVDGVDRASPLPAPLRERGYMLAVGAVEPRKNLVRLAAAHARAATGLPLVLAGPDGWRADALVAEIGDDAIRLPHLPHLPRPALLRLIAGARALAMPSLAEGFGLPVAEAMALGTPVLTSDRGALAETAGGAALTVDPQDEAALAAALARLAADDALCAALAEAGRARAAAFDRTPYAARLIAHHARLLAG